MKEYFIVPKSHMEKLEKLQGRDLAPYSNLLDNKALVPDTTLSLINSYLYIFCLHRRLCLNKA